jgi:hypothetical protein
MDRFRALYSPRLYPFALYTHLAKLLRTFRSPQRSIVPSFALYAHVFCLGRLLEWRLTRFILTPLLPYFPVALSDRREAQFL